MISPWLGLLITRLACHVTCCVTLPLLLRLRSCPPAVCCSRVLGSSFNPNPASGIAKNMMHKLNDAITLHEIHDQAQEKAAMIRAQVRGGCVRICACVCACGRGGMIVWRNVWGSTCMGNGMLEPARLVWLRFDGVRLRRAMH